jgi:septation ring formation regulator EzrA
MTIKIADCSSLEQVVELINDEFATDATPEMIAAKYAYDSCAEAGYGFEERNLDAAFDVLMESGAKFDYAEALEIALEK